MSDTSVNVSHSKVEPQKRAAGTLVGVSNTKITPQKLRNRQTPTRRKHPDEERVRLHHRHTWRAAQHGELLLRQFRLERPAAGVPIAK